MLDIAKMIARVRSKADLRHSEYLEDDAIVDLLQDALSYLYMMVFREQENYFRDKKEINFVQGSDNELSLPAFLSIKNVEAKRSPSDIYPLYPKSERQISEEGYYDDNNFYYWTALTYSPTYYVLLANSLVIYPKKDVSNYTFLLTYIPDVPAIPSEANSDGTHLLDINLPPGITEPFLVYHAAAEANETEQIASGWMARADKFLLEIMKTVRKRDTSFPKIISPYDPFRGRLKGPYYGSDL